MDFYLIIVPVTLASIYMIWKLRGLKKHDQVLFKFCQNRREAMAFLRTNADTLTKDEYFLVRSLLETENRTIHHFNELKPHYFNLREFARWVKTANIPSSLEERINQRPEIQKIYNNFEYASLIAFFKFTPFIKSEISLRIIGFIAGAVAKLGFKKIKNEALKIVEFVTWIEKEANEKHIPLTLGRKVSHFVRMA